jgi:hypothetical protein
VNWADIGVSVGIMIGTLLLIGLGVWLRALYKDICGRS